MSGRENYMVERLDRRKETAASKQARQAHFDRIDRMAERAVSVPFPNAADAVTFLRCVAGRVLKRLIRLDGPHHAVSLFGALARGDDYRALARDLAWEEAERLFKAANDEREGGE